MRKYNSVKNFCKETLNLDSKSPRAARQLKFLQICHHTSNGPMNYESISKVLNHAIPQVGGHMAATADLYKKNPKTKIILNIEYKCLGGEKERGKN